MFRGPDQFMPQSPQGAMATGQMAAPQPPPPMPPPSAPMSPQMMGQPPVVSATPPPVQQAQTKINQPSLLDKIMGGMQGQQGAAAGQVPQPGQPSDMQQAVKSGLISKVIGMFL